MDTHTGRLLVRAVVTCAALTAAGCEETLTVDPATPPGADVRVVHLDGPTRPPAGDAGTPPDGSADARLPDISAGDEGVSDGRPDA